MMNCIIKRISYLDICSNPSIRYKGLPVGVSLSDRKDIYIPCEKAEDFNTRDVLIAHSLHEAYPNPDIDW